MLARPFVSDSVLSVLRHRITFLGFLIFDLYSCLFSWSRSYFVCSLIVLVHRVLIVLLFVLQMFLFFVVLSLVGYRVCCL